MATSREDPEGDDELLLAEAADDEAAEARTKANVARIERNRSRSGGGATEQKVGDAAAEAAAQGDAGAAGELEGGNVHALLEKRRKAMRGIVSSLSVAASAV